MGAAMTAAVGLIIFVGVPWLTSPAPPLSSDEIEEQVLGPEVEGVSEAAGRMVLREEAPEHPVLALLGPDTRRTEGDAGTGELPAPLSVDEVAGAMSEFVRLASAPDVDWEEDDPVSTEDAGEAAALSPVEAPAAVEPVAVPAPGEGVEPEAVVVQELEAVTVGKSADRVPVEEGPVAAPDAEATAVAAAVVEADEEPVVPAEAALAEGPEGADVAVIPVGAGIPEPDTDAAAAVKGPPQGAPMISEAATPSGEPRQDRLHEAGRVGQPISGPPLLPQGVVVPHNLRGVMGYRLPLVSRQEVPDQVVSGVLIPGHTTYVILRKGEWELTGLSAEEIEVLRQAAEAAEKVSRGDDDGKSRRWRLFDLFRRKNRGETP